MNSPMQPFETLCLVELLGLYIQLTITAAYPKYFRQPITAVIREKPYCMSVMDPLAGSYFTSEQVETIFTFLTHLHCMGAFEGPHVSYFSTLHRKDSLQISKL